MESGLLLLPFHPRSASLTRGAVNIESAKTKIDDLVFVPIKATKNQIELNPLSFFSV